MSGEEKQSPQPVLLGLLMNEPRHGYDLYQELSDDLGQVWQVGLSQAYAQLKQLEEAGMVTSQVEPQEGRPARKVYHLTPGGRDLFLDWVRQPVPYLRHIRVEFLARLYFYRRLRLDGLDELVERQKAVCREQIERFAHIAGEAEDDFRRLVLEFRIGQLQAVTEWLDRCVEVTDGEAVVTQRYTEPNRDTGREE
ncbi:MAG TPA: PadR family transcriptional regulator [Anaerolineae bacterium]|nr:PadR family transcriptional regulator [Anaerolineae bacterium]